jgi:Zn-dependent peptidase ImmA (M78 family)
VKLQLSRETEILEIAEDVANESTASGRVCPTRICSAKGIKLVHEAYGEKKFDGMLVYRSGQWVVLCNIDNGNLPGSPRERFTISHELGHYHIPEHRRLLLAGQKPHGSKAGAFDEDGRPEELEADVFAANFLMPPVRFVPWLKARKLNLLEGVLSARKEFDTSLESTAIQAMRHDQRVVAIAKWENDRLGWHRISDKFFRETGYRRFSLKELSQLPGDCATAAALNDSDSFFDSPVRNSVATAAFCFGYVEAGGHRDILLKEQAVRNGRYGVLTIYSIMDEPPRQRTKLFQAGDFD